MVIAYMYVLILVILKVYSIIMLLYELHQFAI